MDGTYKEGEELQEVMYKGKRVQFKVKYNPGTVQHLQSIAENHFKTKKLEDSII